MKFPWPQRLARQKRHHAAAQPASTTHPPRTEGQGERPIVPVASNLEAPTFPWAPPSPQEAFEKRKMVYTPEDKAEAWKETAEVVQRYSDEMIKRWNAEIDTYLVFAGLFSAVLTAFNVQSYVLLQPAGPDPTLAALQQISLQLSSFSSAGSSPTFVNSTHPAFEQTNSPPPPVSRSAVWLNTLWFTSLILSLSSASIGMLVKQWLNEYASGLSSENSRQTARLRQYRLNSLTTWRVGDIVNMIPVLLQLAVALFLAGLLVLLWTLDSTVAMVASVFTGLLTVFALATMLLPSMRRGCAYLSPQSLALYYTLHHGIYHLVKSPVWRFVRPLWCRSESLRQQPGRAPLLKHILQFLSDTMWLFFPHEPRTWRGREQSAIAWQAPELDVDGLTAAYDTSMNTHSLAVCLSDLEAAHVPRCLHRLHKAEERHFGSYGVNYNLIVAKAAGPAVVQNLWADSLLSLYESRPRGSDVTQLKIVNPWRDALERILSRLSLHFGSRAERLSGVGAGGVERIMTALSLLASMNLAAPHESPATLYSFSMLQILREMLMWCDYHGLHVGNDSLRQVAAALYQQLTPPGPWEDSNPRRFLYEHIATVTCLMECVVRDTTAHDTPAGPDHEAILSCVDYALGDLTNVLRGISGEDSWDQSLLSLFSGTLSRLVSFVTEDPRSAALYSLFSDDRVAALEHAVAIVQSVIRHRGETEDGYDFRDSAGNRESLEDKLARLRAMRGRSLAAPLMPQARPPPGADVMCTQPPSSNLIEPPSAITPP